MKPSGILCADLHIRETIPECREEKEFKLAQRKKHSFLKKLQEKHDCPVLVAGDIFDRWKNTPYLLTWALRNISDNIVCVAGQHDLPCHNIQEIEKSSIQVLAEAEKITFPEPDEYLCECGCYIEGFPYGSELHPATNEGSPSIAIIHKHVYKGEQPFPNAPGPVRAIMKQLEGFQLIVSGDNHIPFVEKYKGQLLVNPGSFMRSTAAQYDHKPRVYLWYAETNEVEPIYLPIKEGVVSREHIEEEHKREERKSAFIERLKHDVELGLSFKNNAKVYIAKNRKAISKNVERIIWESMG